ncbi:MAG: hypothetical protein LLF94_12725 [Chlamydiales bacterium]|nr:hypothetical protein [Chlamydiales bacterium]
MNRERTPLERLIDVEQDTRKYGFDWPDVDAVLDQIDSESREIRQAIAMNESQERIKEEVGDLLHGVISLCVFCEYDVEAILAAGADKFSRRMQLVKEAALKRGLTNLHNQTTEFMLELWQEAKDSEA